MDEARLRDLVARLVFVVAESEERGNSPRPRSKRDQEREYIAYSGPTPEHRAAHARKIVTHALRLVRDICGDDVINDAYGVGAIDRRTGLLAIAARSRLAATLFAGVAERDKYCLDSVAGEALAVANGDAAALFARLPERRNAYRLYSAKLEAHRWDAWLEGLGVATSDRHELIRAAYGEPSWDTVYKWKAPLREQWGQARVDNRLKRDRRDGEEKVRMWIMAAVDTWRDELISSGKRYQKVKILHLALSDRVIAKPGDARNK